MRLATWFAEMLEELDEDSVDDAEAINKLRGKVAEAFAIWRVETGYGMRGPDTGPHKNT
jgi:hypothetical protein